MSNSILIADDSKLSRTKIKKNLQELGYENFHEACNGQEAIDMFIQHSPLFMTLDMEMPIFDGMQVVQELLQITNSLNVIWISSVDNKRRMLEAQKLCNSAVIKKPLSKDKLENAIKLISR